jgi:glycerol kinase
MSGYIMALDQGTTSSRAIIFKGGRITGQHSRTHEQIFPFPGWVSHNLSEIWFNTVECMKRVCAETGVNAGEISAIGITNQRETVAAWDKRTGEPAAYAIVWQCKRTAGICQQMIDDKMEDTVRRKTGLLIDPYFSATKIRWMLDNEPEVRRLRDAGHLAVGTMDSYLLYRLCGRHITDVSNASRTMLYNIHTMQWDDDLLRYFDIPVEILPQVIDSSGVAGVTDVLGHAIPVAGVAGDQQAALFGQKCFVSGNVKNTCGTGCFMLMNTDKPVVSEKRLLTTIAWKVGDRVAYALEGSVFNAGSAVEWLINRAKLAVDVREVNDFCESAGGNNGVYFVPAFSGLGAPHWDMNARGTLCGLDLSSNSRHIVRAVMEAIAYQSKDVIDVMKAESGFDITRMRVDGGVSKSDFAMQFQADILQTPVERPAITETTALGAACLAGLGAGVFSGVDDIMAIDDEPTVFVPRMTKSEADALCDRWRRAVERAKGWEGDEH